MEKHLGGFIEIDDASSGTCGPYSVHRSVNNCHETHLDNAGNPVSYTDPDGLEHSFFTEADDLDSRYVIWVGDTDKCFLADPTTRKAVVLTNPDGDQEGWLNGVYDYCDRLLISSGKNTKSKQYHVIKGTTEAVKYIGPNGKIGWFDDSDEGDDDETLQSPVEFWIKEERYLADRRTSEIIEKID